jgi:hypothetical protein
MNEGPVLCHGCETWNMFSKVEEMLDVFERNILKWIYSPLKDEKGWRISNIAEIYDL